MKLSEGRSLQQRVQSQIEQRVQFSLERMKQFGEDERFRLSLVNEIAKYPDGKISEDAVDKMITDVVTSSVSTALDPKAQFTDVLRQKGFRPAEIRATVASLYALWFQNSDPDYASRTHQEMLEPVACYAYEHQEIFNTLKPPNEN